jgi:hypothetical protein
VRRHFGEVPASWLCAYAVARLGGRLPRRTGWQRLVFAAAVTGISAAAAFQLDGSGPKRVARPWLVWLRKTVRPAGSRPSSVNAPR